MPSLSRVKRGGPHSPGSRFITLSPSQIEQATDWARVGLSDEQIARALGMSPSAFSEKKREYPDLMKKLDEARYKAAAVVANKLFVNATNPAVGITKDGDTVPVGPPGGSVEAQKFFLQARLGWRTADAPQVQVSVQMPPLFHKDYTERVAAMTGQVIDEVPRPRRPHPKIHPPHKERKK